MGIEVAIGIMAVLGLAFSVWILKYNAKVAGNDRMEAIHKKIDELNGVIIAIEKIDRTAYPYEDIFNNSGNMYKFYRIRYEVEGRRKLGYGVLIIKQNSYGPALAMNTEWVWKF